MRRTALGAAMLAALAGFALSAAAGAGEEDSLAAGRVEALHIDDVSVLRDDRSDDGLIVELYVRAETRAGEPVGGIGKPGFAIRDNGREVPGDSLVTARLAAAERGAAFAFALDASAKMRGAPFEQAQAALLATLDSAGPEDRVAVLTFSDAVSVAIPFGTPRREWRSRVEALEPDPDVRSTVLYEGVFRAVRMLRDAEDLPRRRLAIVFSDGRDDGSRATLEEVIDLASGDGASVRIPVFVIGFDDAGGGHPKALSALAEDTGGAVFSAQSTDLIASYFARIVHQVHGGYVVRYAAEDDGGRHSIEVAIGDRADTVSVAFPEAEVRLRPWLVGLVALGAVSWLVHRRYAGRAGRLLFLDGPRKGESVAITARLLSVGALPENDIVVPSAAASRYHAQLRRRGRRVLLLDVGSANGTFVNGTAIKHCALEPGDVIQIGDIELAYDR